MMTLEQFKQTTIDKCKAMGCDMKSKEWIAWYIVQCKQYNDKLNNTQVITPAPIPFFNIDNPVTIEQTVIDDYEIKLKQSSDAMNFLIGVIMIGFVLFMLSFKSDDTSVIVKAPIGYEQI